MNYISPLVNKLPQVDFFSTFKTCGNITLISAISYIPTFVIASLVTDKIITVSDRRVQENTKNLPIFEKLKYQMEKLKYQIKNDPITGLMTFILLSDVVVLTTAGTLSLLNRVKKL